MLVSIDFPIIQIRFLRLFAISIIFAIRLKLEAKVVIKTRPFAFINLFFISFMIKYSEVLKPNDSAFVVSHNNKSIPRFEMLHILWIFVCSILLKKSKRKSPHVTILPFGVCRQTP